MDVSVKIIGKLNSHCFANQGGDSKQQLKREFKSAKQNRPKISVEEIDEEIKYKKK